MSAPAPAALPDLDQEVPTNVSVQRSGSAFLLGFDSRVWNYGGSDFRVYGQRASTEDTTPMTVRQIDADTGSTIDDDVGIMVYSYETGHDHWHYQDFEIYELRSAANPATLIKGHKQGFCLTDFSLYSSCGRVQPGQTRTNKALEMAMGIEKGDNDLYPAFIEGQYIIISRSSTPSGRYVLTHRTDPNQRLHEVTRANNAASLLFDLSWPSDPNGVPVTIPVRECEGHEWATTTGCGAIPAAPAPGGGTGSPPPPGASTTPPATTPPPPATGQGQPPAFTPPRPLKVADARELSRRALKRTFGTLPKKITNSCRRLEAERFSCRVSWRRGSRSFRGQVTLKYKWDGANWVWSYKVDVRRRTATSSKRVRVARSAGLLPASIRAHLRPMARAASGRRVAFVCDIHAGMRRSY